MVNRSLHLQEIEVFYILPALRRDVAAELKNQGKSQKDIASLLGVTEAAVSQYMKSKRASLVKFDKDLKVAVKEASKNMICGQTMRKEMQKLLKLARDTRAVCKMHESLEKVPGGCDVCFKH